MTSKPIVDTEKSEGHNACCGAESLNSTRLNSRLVFTILCAFFGILAFSAEAFNLGSIYLYIALWLISYFFGGYFGFTASINAIIRGSFNVDSLMIVAALAAAYIGEPKEGAILLFLFSLSGALQSFALDKSRNAISKLIELCPTIAIVKINNQWQEIEVERVKIGDICLIKPGSIIAIDGKVIAGQSEVNQASITGESIPVVKKEADMVFAGTGNINGTLEIVATATVENSTLSKVIDVVKKAQQEKSKTQSLLERLESKYAFIVILIAVFVAFIPSLFGLQGDYIYKAITFLVIASPCALVISAPACILSAMANAARNGILFKGGKYIEVAAKINMLVFDKTGTITNGKLELVNSHILKGDRDKIISAALAIESRSEHPLAKSLLAGLKHELVISNLPKVENFESYAGRGVKATVAGEDYVIGNLNFLWSQSVYSLDNSLNEQLKANNTSLIYMAKDKEVVAAFEFSDSLRLEAKEFISSAPKIGIDRVAMLTGDNNSSALYVASMLNISEFKSGLLPEEKLKYIDEYLKTKNVAYIGDGINDAPAIAKSTIGISMGRGATDLAIDTADIVLMNNDLSKVEHLIRLAKKTKIVLIQNLSLSVFVVLILTYSNFISQLPLTFAVIGHEGSTLLVVLNGLRLLAFKK